MHGAHVRTSPSYLTDTTTPISSLPGHSQLHSAMMTDNDIPRTRTKFGESFLCCWIARVERSFRQYKEHYRLVVLQTRHQDKLFCIGIFGLISFTCPDCMRCFIYIGFYLLSYWYAKLFARNSANANRMPILKSNSGQNRLQRSGGTHSFTSRLDVELFLDMLMFTGLFNKHMNKQQIKHSAFQLLPFRRSSAVSKTFSAPLTSAVCRESITSPNRPCHFGIVQRYAWRT